MAQKTEALYFVIYRKCIFAGKKAPAGAHPGAQSLESPCFYVYKTQKPRLSIFKNRMSYFEKIKGFCYNLKSDFWLGFRRKRSKTRFL